MWLLAMVLGTLGIIFNVFLAWPQVWRAARVGAEGVAIGTVLIGFLARALWSAYAVRLHDPTLFIGQAPAGLGLLAVAFFVSRDRRHVSRRAAWTMWTGLVVAVAVSSVIVMISPVIFTVLAVGIAAIASLPQLFRVLAAPERSSGVSVAMQWFTAAASTCWLTYGLVTGNWVISLPHLVLLPAAVITACVVLRARRSPAPRMAVAFP
ncbi:hypothetical protein NQ038_14605 [Brevibacterium sp. 50QC2O2]|uniref:hypothetical protein n=1 Tax=Brevibacterium TaxID=1696 RepID=UPI00211BD5CA|nr:MULTISPECIES: hypothetical protein [unclassified Brevibacterium]MCQ9367237.1 hypothetical protein [Brevibacterium sp. 91QC2O2]MCQ9385627.1 hypothetical protein [Brevibacterium sp. 68QC2CO]MCQ9389863.1 hypothetical protein [Brevibacterium sp. 50QC2O2]